MPGNPVGWFEIQVQDMPRAKAFYESAFAVQLQKLEGVPQDRRRPGTWPLHGEHEHVVRGVQTPD